MVVHDCVCQICGKQFTKRLPPSRQKPKYCSNACKGISNRKSPKKMKCPQCGIEFERKVPPCHEHRTFFCSKSCGSRHSQIKRGRQPSSKKTSTCEHCGVEFEYTSYKDRTKRFCSIKCSNVHDFQLGKRGFTTHDEWKRRWTEKYGPEKAEELVTKLKREHGEWTTKYFTGRVVPQEVREKISKTCKGIPNALKGKTFVEFYGEERARELSQEHSRRLREGFASGRLTPPCPCPISIVYSGVRLKSALELTAIKHLEESKGLKLNVDLFYEPKQHRIPWTDDDGKLRTYFPDLWNSRDNELYEVKSLNKFETSRECELKCRFANEYCSKKSIKFYVMTEIEMSKLYRSVLKSLKTDPLSLS